MKDKKESNYDKQIILNFIPEYDYYLKKLKEKWKDNNPSKPCDLISVFHTDDLTKYNSKFAQLSDITDKDKIATVKSVQSRERVRIYLYVHSNRFGKIIQSENITEEKKIIKKKLKFEEISDFFAIYIKPTDSRFIQINLIGCEAGRGKQEHDFFNSFGAKLHRSLKGKHKIINIEIVARVYSVFLANSEMGVVCKKTRLRKTSCGKNKQPGSKVVFYFDKEGNQVVEDAYARSWKNMALAQFLELKEITKVSEKELKMDQLHQDFRDKCPRELLEGIEALLVEKNSFIDVHKNISFWRKTNTRRVLEEIKHLGDHFLNTKNKPIIAKTKS